MNTNLTHINRAHINRDPINRDLLPIEAYIAIH